jgi:hypothetical protein
MFGIFDSVILYIGFYIQYKLRSNIFKILLEK